MKLLATTIFILGLSLLALFQEHKGFETEGTPARVEGEYKIAFETSNNKNLDRFQLKKWLFKLIQTNQLSEIKNIIGNQYYLTGSEEKNLFLDIYFDTKDFKLKKNLLAYRLRYRFKSEDDYLNHIKQPLRARYFPNRVEIQLKAYQSITKDYFTSKETRFEFRNESLPFSLRNDAPPPPWPIDEYIKHATNGLFRYYRLLPFEDLKSILKSDVLLSPVLQVFSTRERYHLNIESKWNTGPNPNQAFIITKDHFYAKDLFSNRIAESNKYNEIEIEFERNTSTDLDNQVNTNNLAKKAKSQFLNDQKAIFQYLKNKIKNENIKVIENDTKYNRLIKDLMDET